MGCGEADPKRPENRPSSSSEDQSLEGPKVGQKDDEKKDAAEAKDEDEGFNWVSGEKAYQPKLEKKE